MGRKPIAGLFSVGLEEQYRWKDSVQNDAEIRIWVLDGIANGMRPWFSKFGGVLHDPRWLKGVEEIYGWTDKFKHYLRHETPIARVALVYSQQTAWFYGGNHATAKVEDHTLGWYQALVEARCEQLRAFVKNGGSLIATYETSLYDEWGVRRKDFGLANLFGVMWNGRIEVPMQNFYLRLKREVV